MFNEAEAKSDIDLFEKASSLVFMQEQISNALKMTFLISQKLPDDNNFTNQFKKAIYNDTVEIDKKAREMFDVLADAFIKKRSSDGLAPVTAISQ